VLLGRTKILDWSLRKSLPTLIVVQHPEELWTNGDDSAIQRIKLVWIHLSRSSDCSSKRLWWVVRKCSKSSKWASIWSIAEQPQELWTNGDHGRIQRIKKVLKYPGPIYKSSDCRWRGRIKPRRKFSISEIGVSMAWLLLRDCFRLKCWLLRRILLQHLWLFTWLYYNIRTEILDNQTLLLAQFVLYEPLGSLRVRLLKVFLALVVL
jgi:hypothetical protein